ncbi:MAG: hypothetical protein R3F17_09030 [Planctomycetota bacterium]
MFAQDLRNGGLLEGVLLHLAAVHARDAGEVDQQVLAGGLGLGDRFLQVILDDLVPDPDALVAKNLDQSLVVVSGQ